MAAELEFCVLGPLLVRRAGRVVRVSAGRQQALLAALLLNSGRVVAVGELAEALWGSAPPPSARASLQTYVMRLRRSLGDAARTRITAHPDGYRIEVAAGELDADRFEALLAGARQAMRSGSYAPAATRLRSALSLWRGQALAGVPSEVLALREVPRLAEMRLQALEARIEADLHLGRHADVLVELKQLAAAEPLRERVHVLLMLALYRDGQQAGALAAYRAARAVLVEELGAEPGPELRELHQQILTADPALAAPHRVAPSDGEACMAGAQRDPVVPRQLPASIPDFAGRGAELAALDALLGRGAGAERVAAITGTAGVGKTALAVYWASRSADHFPDGQLHVDLRGFGPAPVAMTSADALGLLLDGLGVRPGELPPDLDARVAMCRSLLAGKRMLVVLDNARDAAQVRPLLPGAMECLALVTSRNQLAGLAAAQGARLIAVDPPGEAQAREILARKLGSATVMAEPAAAAELVRLCARLPLALSIAAARANARPCFPLAAAAAELQDTRTRLDALATGDAATDVRTVFSWSCEQISQPAARMFGMLGVHPGPHITAPAAASLAGMPLPRARQVLSELARAHLITEHAPGRYACHDLLRAYAAERAASWDSQTARQAACRALDHYLHSAYAAALVLHPMRVPITIGMRHPQVQPEEPAGPEQALAWFRAERQVLVAGVNLAACSGFNTHAWQLSWAMAAFLGGQGYWQELEATQEIALEAARRCGSIEGQAEAHRYLGKAMIQRGAHAGAKTHLSAAMQLTQQLGNPGLEARVQLDIGWALAAAGPSPDRLTHAEQALRLYRTAGNLPGEAAALNQAGWEHAQLGSYHRALDYCSQALALFRGAEDRAGQAVTLDSIGYAHLHLGRYADAVAYYQQAIDAQGEAGDRDDRAEFLTHLGDAMQAAGDSAAARQAWQQALAIFEDLHHPSANQVRSRLGLDQASLGCNESSGRGNQDVPPAPAAK
jgi:DNA-binding SARP family transcriptional activator/predicted negative regulator of RcsB-dependent stress response